ncbi:hypothetical protein J2X31_000958 [Flavobacterium arsenatis]|uniref:Lipoprotein n=1 Tax=Flavobacterium arsenatis TaxID=1484332 RepID=A0ABU1TLW4_9FLAO|nr:hypothetical protein [Flavobacterium arsenatis]MDR6966958.1 hypothetical protein [Flavobacterium arsenatis]
MKNVYKIVGVLFVSLLFNSCEENDVASINDVPFNSVSFPRPTILADIHPATPVYELEVNVTKPSNVDRTFTVVNVPFADIPGNDQLIEATSADYTFNGQITVPAGSVKGYGQINITPGNLVVGVTKTMAFDLVSPGEDGKFTNGKDRVVFSFTRACGDGQSKATLLITFDQYADETSWELYRGSTLVDGDGPYVRGRATFEKSFCLIPGEYTFVLYDSYGDGICCATGNGAYSIKVGGETLISGAPTGVFQEIKTFVIQ